MVGWVGARLHITEYVRAQVRSTDSRCRELCSCKVAKVLGVVLLVVGIRP